MTDTKRPWTSKSTIPDLNDKLPPSVKSASRAFRIMEFFDEVRRPARVIEIAERLDFPQSSTSVLLNALARQGYLIFDRHDRTFFPSLRMTIMSSWIDRGHFRDGSMMNMLESLAEETGYAVSLWTREGIYVRYLHAIQATAPDTYHISIAARRYAVWSAAGIALISRLSDDDVRALLHRTRAENDPMAQNLSTDVVMSCVQLARDQGYFISDGLVIPDTEVLSMQIPRTASGPWPPIALSLAASRPEIRKHEEALVTRMRMALEALPANSDK